MRSIRFNFQGENDKKSDESEEEKYKRARKLYSIRMQKIIKSRLNQSSNSSAVTTEEPIPVRSAAPINPAPIQTPIVRDQTQANNVQHQVETRSFVYDIVIGVVVAVIALLLYRRINMFSAEVLPEN